MGAVKECGEIPCSQIQGNRLLPVLLHKAIQPQQSLGGGRTELQFTNLLIAAINPVYFMHSSFGEVVDHPQKWCELIALVDLTISAELLVVVGEGSVKISAVAMVETIS